MKVQKSQADISKIDDWRNQQKTWRKKIHKTWNSWTTPKPHSKAVIFKERVLCNFKKRGKTQNFNFLEKESVLKKKSYTLGPGLQSNLSFTGITSWKLQASIFKHVWEYSTAFSHKKMPFKERKKPDKHQRCIPFAKILWFKSFLFCFWVTEG